MSVECGAQSTMRLPFFVVCLQWISISFSPLLREGVCYLLCGSGVFKIFFSPHTALGEAVTTRVVREGGMSSCPSFPGQIVVIACMATPFYALRAMSLGAFRWIPGVRTWSHFVSQNVRIVVLICVDLFSQPPVASALPRVMAQHTT